MRIAAGEHDGEGGAAEAGGDVTVDEASGAGREAVDVRREGVGAAREAEVAKGVVIRDDVNDAGRRGMERASEKDEEEKECGGRVHWAAMRRGDGDAGR